MSAAAFRRSEADRLDYCARRMESRIEELKRYVRFSVEDAHRLALFSPRVTPHFRRLATEFYERIREHEEAHAVFTGEDQIQRLQGSMVAWLERVFGGVYDEVYFRKTEQIGRVHVKVGLPQRYMFTAMALIRSSLLTLIGDSDALDARPIADALGRLLDIELAVMLESYREDLMVRVERAAVRDRELTSARAARSERTYVNAVELAPLVIIGLDRNGAMSLFNRAAERTTGYARDEVLGRSFVEVFMPGELRGENAVVFQEGAIELPLLTRSQKVRDVRWLVAPSPPTEEDDVATFVIGADVTGERLVREQHQQQERLAAVGTLAAGLAHEIRNPLNGARLHVSFLERALAKEGGPPDALEALHVVDDEIKRLARLVTEFLEFARPRPLTPSETSMRALCERGMKLVLATAENARVQVTVDLPTHDIVIQADGQRLEQVLLNLLQNAIEALAPHGGHVVVRARREPRHVWFEVEDDGPGLSSTEAPVFDAFYSTKPAGTGLGLAIVHRIVTDHGGSIDVESRPGRTRFRVRLPLGPKDGEA